MNIEECSNEGCDAPICPLDSCPDHIWYSNESICNKRGLGLSWIRTQKKLAKIGTNGFFTKEMLKNIKRVKKGIKGKDPNSRIALGQF